MKALTVTVSATAAQVALIGSQAPGGGFAVQVSGTCTVGGPDVNDTTTGFELTATDGIVVVPINPGGGSLWAKTTSGTVSLSVLY